MRAFFFPAAAPIWLKEVLSSVRAALSDIWPTPIRLKDYVTADLPPAADWGQGLAYDSTLTAPRYSNGTAWTTILAANDAYVRVPETTSIGVGSSTTLSGASGGNRNTALGINAGAAVTTGFRNTVIGYNSGDAITTGSNNVSIGDVCLSACVTGTDNVAIGHDAGRLVTGSNNTLLGSDAGDGLTSGGSNTFVGRNTGIGVTTGGNNTVIGANVTGLATGLTGNIILADGAGSAKLQFDGTYWKVNNGLTNAADDVAAAAAGVPVTGLYRNGSVVMIRVA